MKFDIDFANIDQKYRKRTSRSGGLSEELLTSLVNDATNHVNANVVSATGDDVVNYADLKSSSEAIDSLRNGEIAFVVLAGGAGTRIGCSKPFIRLPKLGMTLAINKLFQSVLTTSQGQFEVPTWFMASPEMSVQLLDHLKNVVPQPSNVTVFEQFESYRLTTDNRIMFTDHGTPMMYPTGHGDVGPALVESGILDDHQNIKHCVIVNCDNVLASLDLRLLTHHITTNRSVTCEVIARQSSDVGGVLARVDGKLQIVEQFRLSNDVIERSLYHNTNSMIISVEALRKELCWRWYRVNKHVDDDTVVQYERLLQQYTEDFESNYVLVDRHQRYLPIKTEADTLLADNILDGNRRT